MSTPACCDPGQISVGTGSGKVVQIAGANSYLVGKSNTLVIFATDVFGYLFPNIVAVAEQYAKAGLTVIIPDLFNGDWLDFEAMAAVRSDPVKRGELFGPWVAKHAGEKFPFALYDSVINESSKSGDYTSIHLIGFCYGAKLVMHSIAQGNVNSLVKSAAVAHPSFLNKDDGEKASVPVLYNCAEIDEAFTPELKKSFEDIMENKKNGSKFILYPGVSHGFAVRPDGSPEQAEQQRKSHENAIEWFKSHA